MTDDLVKRLRKRREVESIDGYKRVEWEDEDALTAADRIEGLQAALNKIIQKCPYARREQWCSNLDCNCVVAREALGVRND